MRDWRIVESIKLTTRWPNMAIRHLTTLSISSFPSPSSEIPGVCVNPWAISCELTYCRLDVEEIDSDEAVSEKGEPSCEGDGSETQWTAFLGVAAMVDHER